MQARKLFLHGTAFQISQRHSNSGCQRLSYKNNSLQFKNGATKTLEQRKQYPVCLAVRQERVRLFSLRSSNPASSDSCSCSCSVVKLFLGRAGLHVLLLQGSHWRSEEFLYCLRSDARAKPIQEKRVLASEFPLYCCKQHRQSVRFQASASKTFSFSGVSCESKRKPKVRVATGHICIRSAYARHRSRSSSNAFGAPVPLMRWCSAQSSVHRESLSSPSAAAASRSSSSSMVEQKEPITSARQQEARL